MGQLNTPCLDKGSVEKTLNEIQTLQTHRQFRDSRKLLYIEGVRNFVQASDTKADITKIIYSERLLINPLARKLVRKLRREGVPTFNVTPEAFRSVSLTKRASGIGAVVSQNWSMLHRISPRTGLCWIVLEQVRSPGNLGTLIRTSEAIGGAGFILLGNTIDPYNPATVRSTMGAFFNQQFIRTGLEALTHWIRRHNCSVIGASPDGEKVYYNFNYPNPTLLFLGEERKGLTALQRELCNKFVRIPMVGKADSMNVAVAGSILMYDLYRSKGCEQNKVP